MPAAEGNRRCTELVFREDTGNPAFRGQLENNHVLTSRLLYTGTGYAVLDSGYRIKLR